MAAHMLEAGVRVLAIDSNRFMMAGFRERYESVEPGVESIIQQALQSGQLQLSSEYAEAAGSEAIILCIPLLVNDAQRVDKEPFLECVEQLVPALRNQTLLLVETSVPVGFCRKQIQLVLSNAGLVHEHDYFLAASPERIKSGTMLQQLQQIPRVLGGLTESAGKQALSIYRLFFREEQLVLLPSVEAAEFTKLAGMVYRDINIALSNQLAIFAQSLGIDLVELIPLINADREAALLQPGIGVGGHCTPVYPYFMMENFREAGLNFSLAAEGRRINESMAQFAWSQLKLNLQHKEVLILGLAFRPQVKEDALSVSYALRNLLSAEGVKITLHDPYYTVDEIEEKGFTPCTDIYSTTAEAVILVTMHDMYNAIDWEKLAAGSVRWVLDGRNQLDREKISTAGLHYIGIGRS